MPPVSLLDHAYLAGPHYKLADGRCVAAGLAYRVGEGRAGVLGLATKRVARQSDCGEAAD